MYELFAAEKEKLNTSDEEKRYGADISSVYQYLHRLWYYGKSR